jgi:hypothetical protein
VFSTLSVSLVVNSMMLRCKPISSTSLSRSSAKTASLYPVEYRGEEKEFVRPMVQTFLWQCNTNFIQPLIVTRRNLVHGPVEDEGDCRVVPRHNLQQRRRHRPAYFNDSQRQATKDAGTISGMNVFVSSTSPPPPPSPTVSTRRCRRAQRPHLRSRWRNLRCLASDYRGGYLRGQGHRR